MNRRTIHYWMEAGQLDREVSAGARDRPVKLRPETALGVAATHAVRLAPEGACGGLVPVLFVCHDRTMKDDLKPVSRQDLGFDIEMALLKARSLWPSRSDHSRDSPYGAMADAID